MTAETLPAVQPRPDWMRQHVEMLFRHAFQEACLSTSPIFGTFLRFEIRAIHPTIKSGGISLVNADTFPLTDDGITQGVEWACKLNAEEGFNVYVGVNPRKPDMPPGKAATADDVYPLFGWQFADADSPAAVEALRNNPGPLHKIVVATGLHPTMRVHCYWELEEPTRNPEAWAETQRHLQAAFGTDAVHDTPRILRLAGSISYPSEKKAAKGYRTEIVQIQIYDDREAVEPSALLAIPAPKAAQGEPAAPPATGSLHLTSGNDPVALVEAIKRGENLHNNTRDMIAHLVGSGRADWEIQTLAEGLLEGRSDGGTLAEIPALIAGARQKYNKPSPAVEGVPIPEAPISSAPKPAGAYRGDPPPRQWIIDNWLVQGAVNSLYGDGGVGKTLLAQQLALCVATGTPFLDLTTKRLPTLAILCEDDEDEVWRRSWAMMNAFQLGYNSHVNDALLWSRVGADNFLLAYNNGRPMLTPFYARVLDYLRSMGPGPKLLMLDTLADTFGGDEIQRAHANYFVKTTLGSICLATNTTVLLLAHPSRAGMAMGDMLSGSTAWHNAVRSRMALQWVTGEDGKPDPDMSDRRVFTRPKANYAQANAEIILEYRGGAFFPMAEQKSFVEEKGMRQVVFDEIASQAARGTPLGYFGKSQRPAKKHRFMRGGKRLMPKDVERIVDDLINEKSLVVYNGRGKAAGLYPVETGY